MPAALDCAKQVDTAAASNPAQLRDLKVTMNALRAV